MDPSPFVPPPDVLPVPSPLWLVELLLHVTFTLHVLAMNLLVGGAMIAVVEQRRATEASRRLAGDLRRLLPTVTAFTVTFGVAPLLFLQTLYGHLFYTSSVLMAWPWFLVIPALLVVYYLLYAAAFRGEGRGAGLVVWSLVGLLAIAFVYVNNMTLAVSPEKWGVRWAASAGGWHANLDDPSVLPRWLHMMLGAAAVAGLGVCVWGSRRLETNGEDARHRVRVGAAWFLVPTGIQFVIGFWLLITQPRDVLLAFLGGSGHATGLLLLGLVTALAALLLLTVGHRRPDPRPWVDGALGLLLLTMVTMILVRDFVRKARLAPHFDASELAVEPQVGVISLFVVLFVGGIVTVAWMVRALAFPARRA
jgi:hypothetical protein